jgi:hypothetical protein
MTFLFPLNIHFYPEFFKCWITTGYLLFEEDNKRTSNACSNNQVPNVVMPFSLLLKLTPSPPALLRVNLEKNGVGLTFPLKLLSIRVLFPVMDFYAWIRTVAVK